MATACLYETDEEQRLHSEAIQRLSRDLEMPEEEIRRVYEALLGGLKARARIKDYLVVLVSRNVRNMIKRH